jgi:hypothetical protein
MKKMFLTICVATFSYASAQENESTILKVLPPVSKTGPFLFHNGTDTFSFPDTHMLSPIQQLLPQAKLHHILPNGNKVYSLPQDNMPCVVPDMSQFNMPDVRSGMSPYTIPNPAYPPGRKVETPAAKKLKELQELLNKVPKSN